MPKHNPGKTLLENAYRLETPEDNIAYYKELAETYDEDFAGGLGYALPAAVARQYRALSTSDDAPIIDIGCGTGLLATELNMPDVVIDGLDISEAMLKLAEQKDCYRNLLAVDLSQPVEPSLKDYGAVLSTGTFTHGHLGPDALVRLLDIAKDNALFILSINKEHHQSLGFKSVIDSLLADKRITNLSCEELNIYRTTGHEHSNDKGIIVSFRKA